MVQTTEEKVYRIYVSECLRLLTQTNAGIAKEGPYVTMKYQDLIAPKPVDNRTGEEIKADMLKKLQGGGR